MLNHMRWRNGRANGLTPAAGVWGFAGMGSLLLVAGLSSSAVSGRWSPELTASLESVTAVIWLTSLGALALRFHATRRLRELFVFAGVGGLGTTLLASQTVPALLGTAVPSLAAAPALVSIFLGACFLIAARAGERPAQGDPARLLLAAGAAALLGALAALLASSLLGELLVGASAAAHPGQQLTPGLMVVAVAPGAAMLVLAGLRLATQAGAAEPKEGVWLAGVALLLAAETIAGRTLFVGGSELASTAILRLVAVSLLASTAITQVGRELTAAAARREHRRLADDLHDGLCQDLAFIASYATTFEAQAGTDHPVVVAARRALAVSRGALAELSASSEPDISRALRSVAAELSRRFDIAVDVSADAVTSSQEAREELVRIAREAIVNAATHGGATRVELELLCENERLVLRVSDNGHGIATDGSASEGFGMAAMRSRSLKLGAVMSAGAARDGGTAIEVVVGR